MVSMALATLDLLTHDAVAFLPAPIDHELLEPPDTGTESWLQPRSASCSAEQ